MKEKLTSLYFWLFRRARNTVARWAWRRLAGAITAHKHFDRGNAQEGWRWLRWTVSPLLAVLMLSSCATTGANSNVITAQRVYAVSSLASFGTAWAMVQNNPERREPLGHVRDGFCALQNVTNLDLTTLADLARTNGLDALNSAEGRIILATIPLFEDLFTGQRVPLTNEYARAFVSGTCRGLTLALGPRVSPVLRMNDSPEQIKAKLHNEAVATRPKRK